MRVGIKGKRYSRSTRTTNRAQAERFLQRFLSPFGLGEKRLPLAEVWLEYVKSPRRNELAKATMESKRQIWIHFASWMELHHLSVTTLGEITPEMIAEYLACIQLDLCGTSYNNRVCVLREIFRLLASRAGIEKDPWEGVRLRPNDSHSRRELTPNELRRLLAAAEKFDAELGIEWRALILIGIYTGLRLGDCCNLDWSQINLAQEIIQVIPRKTRRYHQRMVTIPIHPALGQALLKALRPASPMLAGPVLPRIAAIYAQSRWRISVTLSQIFRRANIATSIRIKGRKKLTPDATFHSLRHTFVSFAANAGVPLHIVQAIVGHESTAMTRHYYHESIDSLKLAVKAIPMF